MNKKLIPTYFKKSIFEIDFNKVKQLGINYIFCDLDNTLASPYVYEADESVINLVKDISYLGLKLFVFSNNHEQRVKKFVSNLNVDYLYEIKKPNIKKVLKYVNDNNIDLSTSIVIGDQVLTDILMANRLNVKSILVDRLTNKDEPITFFPRLVDKIARKKLHKKKLTKEF